MLSRSVHALSLVIVFSLAVAALSPRTVAAAEDGEHVVHTWKKIQLSDKFYGEGAHFGDFNKDGHGDVVSGPYWYEGPNFNRRHAYYEPKVFDPLHYSDNFFAFTHDFNGDGWTDILIYGFPGKDASWFENPGDPHKKEGHWKRHVVFDTVDNESPTWGDLTGDGKPEIICQTGGALGYVAVNWKNPTQKWTFHKISDNKTGGRFTHGLGFGDVDGDGKMDILEKRGWWQQPKSLEGDPMWQFHAHPFSGQGGAQMYAYDVNGDGRNDVITSLAAHGYGLAWHEQQLTASGEITFKQHTIMSHRAEDSKYGLKFSQLHAVDLIDMDGDGLKDIVTGKRWWAHGPRGDAEPNAAAVVYWFRLTRDGERAGGDHVNFVPYLIDDDSGVGTQVVAGDINGDKLPDIIVGNKKGTFVHLHSVKKVSKEEWEKAQPKAIKAEGNANANAQEAPAIGALPKAKFETEGLTAEQATKAMSVPPGVKVTLAAKEPDVSQPIAMAIDHRGRIWVAEAYSYPRRVPEDQARDRILIFEDTDGDGTLDKRTIFHDKLNLVSGIEVGYGGVWVGAAPHLLFIPDKDGDDKPDGEPRILLDGWGYQDTHETLNSFTWGPDGWLYGCHGVFTHSKVGKPGTPDEKRTPLNAGVWRYHPIKHTFEVFAYGTSNPWGVDFDEHGQCIITACVIPHLYHMVQGGRYQRQGGKHFNPHVYDDIKTIADHAHYVGNIRDHAHWGHTNDPPADTLAAGGGHAHAGAMIYLGGAMPDAWRGRVFMNNIHGARVNTDILRRKGSGFVGSHGEDFLIANDLWSQIIALKYGPDGSIWFIDWYDRNQCHRGDPAVHDRTNGRIYRLSYGEHKAEKVDLSKLSDLELANLHTHENEWYVRTARRLLAERAATKGTVASALWRFSLMLEGDVSDLVRLRILWTFHATGESAPYVTAYIDNPLSDAMQNEYFRAWKVQFAVEDGEADSKLLAKLLDMAKHDPSPVVRLYLASALQRLPLEQRWDIANALVQHAEDADDHNIPLVLWYGIEPLVQTDKLRAAKLAAATKIPLVRQFIARRLAGGAAPNPEPAKGHIVEGAIEGEKMKVAKLSAGNARPQPMGAFTAAKWSGTDQLWWTGGKPGATLNLEFNVPKAGKFNVIAAMTKARDYGIVQLSLDGKKVGKPLDLYNDPDVITTGDVSLGTHALSPGKHTLTVEITGANPKAVKGYMFGLDYLLLKPAE